MSPEAVHTHEFGAVSKANGHSSIKTTHKLIKMELYQANSHQIATSSSLKAKVRLGQPNAMFKLHYGLLLLVCCYIIDLSNGQLQINFDLHTSSPQQQLQQDDNDLTRKFISIHQQGQESLKQRDSQGTMPRFRRYHDNPTIINRPQLPIAQKAQNLSPVGRHSSSSMSRSADFDTGENVDLYQENSIQPQQDQQAPSSVISLVNLSPPYESNHQANDNNNDNNIMINSSNNDNITSNNNQEQKRPSTNLQTVRKSRRESTYDDATYRPEELEIYQLQPQRLHQQQNQQLQNDNPTGTITYQGINTNQVADNNNMIDNNPSDEPSEERMSFGARKPPNEPRLQKQQQQLNAVIEEQQQQQDQNQDLQQHQQQQHLPSQQQQEQDLSVDYDNSLSPVDLDSERSTQKPEVARSVDAMGDALAAQLPSQYDATIRLPPEGYYDDYYKPSSISSTSVGVHTNDVDSNGMVGNSDMATLSTTMAPSTNYSSTNQATDTTTSSSSSSGLDENTSPPIASPEDSRVLGFDGNFVATADNDSIKLILANTNNSSLDPVSNEKVINYISESSKEQQQQHRDTNNVNISYHNEQIGSNFNATNNPKRGSSPRETFVNKDMNELPVGDSNVSCKSSKGPEGDAPGGVEGSTTEGAHRVDAGPIGDGEGEQVMVVAAEGRARRLQPTGRSRRMPLIVPPVGVYTTEGYDPSILPMTRPTRQPKTSLGNEIMGLPSKISQMREQQPDKNELMNELLSALDRVKVAIYNLQPLTAKMNAIYRKSVSSNSRDIIMDHHKGTYAKRYPPGDYDDSYHRLHVSELAANDAFGPDQRRLGASRLPPSTRLERNRRQAPEAGSETELEATGSKLANSPNDTQADQEVDSGVGKQISNVTVIKLTSGDQMASDSMQSADQLIDFGIGRRFGQSEEPESSSFGYKITIYQTPSTESGVEFDDSASDDDASDNYNRRDQEPGKLVIQSTSDDVDLMATSESSQVEVYTTIDPQTQTLTQSSQQPTGVGQQASETAHLLAESPVDSIEPSESSSNSSGGSAKAKRVKNSTKESSSKHKGKRRMSSRDRMSEGESKRKKEYKKIKHNKGVVSKERKSMHRDKHVKSHDRGAAKEKALKEKTQIEFFEREQIVDDESDKSHKSSSKGAWQSGYESKKASGSKYNHNHKPAYDSMSSAGSHYVKHHDELMKKADVSTSSSDIASAKKHEQVADKHADSKAKKFKGWREKGYKIITETEFIDRGSLHDSAYKKRDKGEAHEQKIKKHEISSEGHHGSLVESTKKLKKKVRKDDKSMHEKAHKRHEDKHSRGSKDGSHGAKHSSVKSPDIDTTEASIIMTASVPEETADSNNNNKTTTYDNQDHELLMNILEASSRDENDDRLSVSSRTRRNSTVDGEPAIPVVATFNVGSQATKSSKVIRHQTNGNGSINSQSLSSLNNKHNTTILDIVNNPNGGHLNKTKYHMGELEQTTPTGKINNNPSFLGAKHSNSARPTTTTNLIVPIRNETHHGRNNRQHSAQQNNRQQEPLMMEQPQQQLNDDNNNNNKAISDEASLINLLNWRLQRDQEQLSLPMVQASSTQTNLMGQSLQPSTPQQDSYQDQAQLLQLIQRAIQYDPRLQQVNLAAHNEAAQRAASTMLVPEGYRNSFDHQQASTMQGYPDQFVDYSDATGQQHPSMML